MRMIKELVRDGKLHRWYIERREQTELAAWKARGENGLPPQAYKKKLLRDLARKYSIKVLVESGTNYGGTVAASLGAYREIYSIELYDELFKHVSARFQGRDNVHLFHGDSGVLLPQIISRLSEPAVFWLDAHYSGEGTGRAELDSPIIKELMAVFSSPIRNHVIVIDDARLFVNRDGYPDLETCRTLVKREMPDHTFVVQHDIIRIEPQ